MSHFQSCGPIPPFLGAETSWEHSIMCNTPPLTPCSYTYLWRTELWKIIPCSYLKTKKIKQYLNSSKYGQLFLILVLFSGTFREIFKSSGTPTISRFIFSRLGVGQKLYNCLKHPRWLRWSASTGPYWPMSIGQNQGTSIIP